jgi:two-component system nitrogen regulation response regulator GlnG
MRPAMRELFRAIGKLAQAPLVGVDHRGNRHRQRTGRARAASAFAARAATFCRLEYRRHSRRTARIRAVRPRTRRVHRRSQAATRDASSRPTAAPCSWTRSATCPPHFRRALLRVLAEGEFFRIGGRELIRVDVRVIAATHQALDSRWLPMAVSAPISCTVWMWFASTCHHYDNAARMYPH